MPNEIKIINPALHFYYFAPKLFFQEKLSFEETNIFFRTLWDNCDKIGIKDKNPALGVAIDFPSVTPSEINFHPLAAKINAESKKNKLDQHAFFFEHFDYVGLIISIESDSKTNNLEVWKELHQTFSNFFPSPPIENVVIDCFYLYTGLLLESSERIKTIEEMDSSKNLGYLPKYSNLFC